jgi:hypothetical protein
MSHVVLLVSGSREITNAQWCSKCINDALVDWNLTPRDLAFVVNGNARGVDKHALVWARDHGVKVQLFEPDWNKYGKKAGILRNDEMLALATHVITLWDGKSPGTAHVIRRAKETQKEWRGFINE